MVSCDFTSRPMTLQKWQFSPRFRRGAFGWKSDAPIQRIKEAVSEIKKVSKKELVLAAEGAVLFLEKLSPAIEQVDGSSGAIGTAVNRAIETLVPIIAKADVDQTVRQRWLERLWDAVENDEIPYLEGMGNFWGELCGKPEIASHWADAFLPTVASVWGPSASGHGYFKGTTACLSALYSANRHEELLTLLETARFKWWPDRRWGVKALLAMGRNGDALGYAESSAGLNSPRYAIAAVCEEILLSTDRVEEAYVRYAIEANQHTTNLATFRAIARKYPRKPPETILRDLEASRPGEEGKWFAAAKDAGLFDLALEFAGKSPTDPRTLVRAAGDFAVERPPFALGAGLLALEYIARGYGYDITSADVLDAYSAVIQAADAGGVEQATVHAAIRHLLATQTHGSEFVGKILVHRLHV